LQNSAVLVNCNLANDERSRAFECVLAEKFVLEEKGQVVTTRIDGSDSQTISIFCRNVKQLVKSSSLSKELVPTLYIPVSKDFPGLDFFIIYPNKVVGIQVTFQNLTNKVGGDNPLFTARKFADVRKLYPLLPPGDTFVESLLSITSNPCGKVVQADGQNLKDSEGDIHAFEYIIITSSSISEEETYKNLAVKYPWIRVIHRSNLCGLLPEHVVQTLPDNKRFQQVKGGKSGGKEEKPSE